MNIDEINSCIKEIADHFGTRNQQLKLIEELSELIKELALDVANDRDITDKTISEIADVNILINQILYRAGDDTKEKVKQQIEYKLERTIQRINNGYYK